MCLFYWHLKIFGLDKTTRICCLMLYLQGKNIFERIQSDVLRIFYIRNLTSGLLSVTYNMSTVTSLAHNGRTRLTFSGRRKQLSENYPGRHKSSGQKRNT